MGNKATSKCCAESKAKKKVKKGTPVTTDDRASMMPIDHAVSADAVSETAIESDEEVAITMHPSKAKASAGGAPVVAMTQDCGAWCQFSLSFLFSSPDLDIISGCPC